MYTIKNHILNFLGKKSFYLLEFYYVLRYLAFYRGRKHSCPCCGADLDRFLPLKTFSGKIVPNLICPRCDSHPRHRLLWLYFSRLRQELFTDRIRLLHIAPEFCFSRRFRKMDNLVYVTFDLASPLADCHADICSLPFADNTFDVILCNHVLEHVAEDGKAMAQLFRVLRPDGWGIMQVPLDKGLPETIDDPLVTDPMERERLFGQHDHVRLYGRDYSARLEKAGFTVDVLDFAGGVDTKTVNYLSLDSNEAIYLCEKVSKVKASGKSSNK
jgi:hypothetical protein